MKREEERELWEWEGGGRRGGNGNFYNLIKLLSKKPIVIEILEEKNVLFEHLAINFFSTPPKRKTL